MGGVIRGHAQQVWLHGSDDGFSLDVNLLVGGVDVSAVNSLPTDANLQIGGADVGAANPVPVADVWTPTRVVDTNADDSDKTFTVPANVIWHILGIYVDYTSTGDAGDRQLVVELYDDNNVLIDEVRVGVVQAATLNYFYSIAPGVADLTAVRDTTFVTTPLPVSWIIPADYDIRVYDNNAVAAAADDMLVTIRYATRPA